VFEGQGPDAPVWSDPDALRHLAEILLRNALEATAEGETIRVTARDEDGMLRWTFQDHGRGMSSAEAEHLFDLFYCGRQAGRGLGLGLPRAARAASGLGGELRWHSAPGRGTTFQVHLPRIGPPLPLATVDSPHLPVEEEASDAQGLGNAR
jgi:signal transduction histidine kinase